MMNAVMMSDCVSQRSTWRPSRQLVSRLVGSAISIAISATASSNSFAVGDGVAWRTHQDALGFEVRLPSSWQVSAIGLENVAIGDAQGNSVALIRARVARGELARWLANEYPASEPGMRNLSLLRVESLGPHAARAALTYVNPAGVRKRAGLLVVRHGDIATVFVAATPADRYADQMPVMSQVLDSFRFTPATGIPAPTASETQRYVAWNDPRENAFSMQIPAEWRADGGMFRVGSGTRTIYTVTAPDGRGHLYSGDFGFSTAYAYPTPMTASLGFREGSPTGAGGPILMRFQDAAQIGPRIVQQRFSGARITAVRPRPDLLEVVRRNPVLQGAEQMASAADIEFVLPGGQIGVMSLTTHGQRLNDLGGLWHVDHIHGFVAAPDRVVSTAMALANLVGTFRVNPQWFAAELGHQRHLMTLADNYHRWSADLQRRTLEQRWASDDARNRQFRDALGGTVRLRDPVSGEVFETTASDRYYYRAVGADRPTAVGTATDFNPLPQLDMRRMLTIGVDTPDR